LTGAEAKADEGGMTWALEELDETIDDELLTADELLTHNELDDELDDELDESLTSAEEDLMVAEDEVILLELDGSSNDSTFGAVVELTLTTGAEEEVV